MPRNMSFALTTEQFKNRTKTVTRRLGWQFLNVGDIVQGVEKCQGLRKGEKVVPLAMIKIIGVSREPLLDVDEMECQLEGFPEMSPMQFIKMFMTHNKLDSMRTFITRIEFEYISE